MLPRSDLGGNAQQKSTSYEMLILFSNSPASRNIFWEILRISFLYGLRLATTRECLRELHSLTVSKSVRFLYSEFRRCSWDVKLSIGWSENIQLPAGENLGKLYPPGFLSKYFRPHLVNWADFAPSMTSAQITPAPAVAAYRLTPELSGFSHIWDKLASISLNGCFLIKILATIIMGILRISETDDL